MLLKNYLVVEGPDGMGKGFVVDIIKSHLAGKNMEIADLIEYQADMGFLPEPEMVLDKKVLFVGEPLAGNAYVRREMLTNIGKGRNYSGAEVALGMAHDRLVLFKKIILPATANGALVVSDRSLMASLVYQMIQSEQNHEGLTYGWIKGLPGNELAAEHPPAYVLVVNSTVEKALERKAKREKKDNCGFEEKAFMEKVLAGYLDPGLWKLYEEQGTRMIPISNDEDVAEGLRGRVHAQVEDAVDDWLSNAIDII